MSTKHSVRRWFANGVWLMLIAVFSLGAASVALAVPPQDGLSQPRPTLTPELRPTLTPAATQPTENPTVPPVTTIPTELPATVAPLAPSRTGCESICGRVINLTNSSGVEGVVVRFGGNGWALDAQTDGTGTYGYGRLGLDVGLLNVVLPEGSDLHPVTHDIAFAPSAGQATFINLGVYRGGRAPRPFLVPTVSVSPERARQGEQVVFTVGVQNSLDTAVSGVWITDLLPPGLSLSGVSSDHGDTVRSGNYVAVHVAGLAAGEIMTATIYANVSADAPAGILNNTVSLIYSEYAAAQATARLYVQTTDPIPVAFPVTGHGLSAFGAGLGLAFALLAIRYLRLRRSGAKHEDKGD